MVKSLSDSDYELLTSSRFYLERRIDGEDDRIDGYFMECQGFERTQEAIELCQVTPQKWGKDSSAVGRVMRSKIPGNAKSSNLTLRRRGLIDAVGNIHLKCLHV